MKGHCNYSGCGFADGLGCERGDSNPSATCPHFRAADGEPAPAAGVSASHAVSDETSFRLPWSGRALGLNDMVLGSARSRAELIAFVGPYNAGKTALLTALFTHLAKTGRIDDEAFAGSFSLEGWSRLREYTKWPDIHGHSFPPHTPDSHDRVPSLLHLAFRRENRNVRDYFFTDAPGEWFTRWLKNRNADDAGGARWIMAQATQLVYTVDREGLVGKDRGTVSHTTRALAKMVAEQRNDRRLIVAWTKSDKVADGGGEQAVRAALQDTFGTHTSMNVSVFDGSSLDLLRHLLDTSVTPLPVLAAPSPRSPFMAYQGEAL